MTIVLILLDFGGVRNGGGGRLVESGGLQLCELNQQQLGSRTWVTCINFSLFRIKSGLPAMPPLLICAIFRSILRQVVKSFVGYGEVSKGIGDMSSPIIERVFREDAFPFEE